LAFLKLSRGIEVLSIALSNLNITLAFVFGSVARNEITASSDIDLMIVGESSLKEVSSALAGLPEQLGREVNPVLLSPQEFPKRISKGEHFITRVLESPRIFVVGTEADFETMA
jgi:predicted nucleotidyltransferase